MFANFIKFDLLNHMMCTNLIPKFQKVTITKRDKKPFQSWEKRSQIFTFLDILGYLVMLWPNGFGVLNQTWNARSQGSGTSSCKILDTSVNLKHYFLPRKDPKMLEKCLKNV